MRPTGGVHWEPAESFGVGLLIGDYGGFKWNAKDEVCRMLNRCGATTVGNHLA